ncbi:rho GTPase-activating protein 45 isoform X2 [Hemicordylus capensis]|uniref:rho GTPase-activating protein 45 isoform X2 n=1 Tax=Hemicordylus capensis TaxID=884348 RepID=UPI0023036741|nr:rho GTPase-activating protein 45 isoform X2 [Hemicordylus capensis]XP_053153134.1 rho GTPase-activating protein 45 isoform X2 [Hemicordylus capensis]XP_053153136.1 rho GTPase-activating protein 45 isoform X2 [Hemicordylus capensis]XP_053153137.1 rho GTPase-activating protein 45 isoform X2 [Hemicordylus capensis]
MFSRKKRELMKTPSISKKCRAGSPVPQASLDLPRRDGLDASSSSLLDLSTSAPAGTLKRPTSLSRHASAAGFPLSPAIPRSLAKGHKAHMAYSPCEGGEGSLTEPEDISQLLADVARFAEALEKLKDVMLREEELDSRRPVAHEYLGEALWILRQVVTKYPLLNTLETLTAAGTLISKVKGFHYEANHETDKREFERALEMIAVSFSSTVSEFLMGEVDSSTLLSVPPSDQNQSMENLYGAISGQSPEETLVGMDDFSLVRLSAEEVDVLLQKCEGGVEVALGYAKHISKYMKDLINYLEKRTTLEIEFAKGLQKMANSCKQTITQEPYMPFHSIYSLALEQDMDYGVSSLQAAITLQKETFLQPLTARRLEHEKRRKEIKEQWHRAKRKLQEAESNLRKAKQLYMQRSEEYEKAKFVAVKAGGEQLVSSTTTATKALDKKRRLEEEAKNKADEAIATYRTCIADANTQKQELEDTKVTSLRQIHEVVKQSDQVIKSATISFYQLMHMQTAPLPVNFQTLCESSKLYDPGQQYASHVKRLQRGDEPETQYDFEPYIGWPPLTRLRKGSFNASEFAVATGPEAAGKEGSAPEGEAAAGAQELQTGTAIPERRGGRGHQAHKSWPSAVTETKGSLEPHATNSGEFTQKFRQVPSNGALSPGEESVGNSPSFEQSINGIPPEISTPTGPFRNVGLSKAAQTHRLRKLRTPSKCRECNSYVYFQGAECEECHLACHKKCLETLAIQCGHKKLQGKLQLFGQDFVQASCASPDGIPFIIKKCISEIERRALKTKGIYRVNGVKTRVEKLCQAFENGKELVELSQASPHDISNVLKLYLRQLPEPIMPFRTYNQLMGMAKESLQGGPEGKASKDVVEVVDRGAETDKVVVTLVAKLALLLRELPRENLATLKYIVEHLRRIVQLEQENKMSAGNLGIVFGPTLMRPRPTEATISLSSLVDYPHQARIVEALITFHSAIFEAGGAIRDGAAEEEPEEGGEHVGSQEDVSAQLPDSIPCLVTVERTEAAEQDDLYREPRERSIDSDSDPDPDPEDSPEPDARVAPRITQQRSGSESSGDEEVPFIDEGGEEGARSRTYSTSQSDPEDASPCGPIREEDQHELEEDAVFKREGEVGDEGQPLADYNSNQSNNTLFSRLLGYRPLW